MSTKIFYAKKVKLTKCNLTFLCLALPLFQLFLTLFLYCVPRKPWRTRVIIGSMNMGYLVCYLSVFARTQTRNLFSRNTSRLTPKSFDPHLSEVDWPQIFLGSNNYGGQSSSVWRVVWPSKLIIIIINPYLLFSWINPLHVRLVRYVFKTESARLPYITAYKSNYLGQNINLEDRGVDLSVDLYRKVFLREAKLNLSQHSSHEKSN